MKEPPMAIAKNPEPKNEDQFDAEPVVREPGFYIDNGEFNGPYPSAEDANLALDGVFAGKGSVVEVPAE
jgi:hypothetical protein